MELLAVDNRMCDLCSSIWIICKNPICLSMFSCFYSPWPQVTLDQYIFPAAGKFVSISKQETISNNKLLKQSILSNFSQGFLSLIRQFSHASLTFFSLLKSTVRIIFSVVDFLLGAKLLMGKLSATSTSILSSSLFGVPSTDKTLSLKMLAVKHCKLVWQSWS